MFANGQSDGPAAKQTNDEQWASSVTDIGGLASMLAEMMLKQGQMQESLEKGREKMQQHIGKVEHRAQQVETKQSALEERVVKLESGVGAVSGPSGSDQPSGAKQLEINGRCSWENWLKEGATRSDSQTMVSP